MDNASLDDSVEMAKRFMDKVIKIKKILDLQRGTCWNKTRARSCDADELGC